MQDIFFFLKRDLKLKQFFHTSSLFLAFRSACKKKIRNFIREIVKYQSSISKVNQLSSINGNIWHFIVEVKDFWRIFFTILYFLLLNSKKSWNHTYFPKPWPPPRFKFEVKFARLASRSPDTNFPCALVPPLVFPGAAPATPPWGCKISPKNEAPTPINDIKCQKKSSNLSETMKHSFEIIRNSDRNYMLILLFFLNTAKYFIT